MSGVEWLGIILILAAIIVANLSAREKNCPKCGGELVHRAEEEVESWHTSYIHHSKVCAWCGHVARTWTTVSTEDRHIGR